MYVQLSFCAVRNVTGSSPGLQSILLSSLVSILDQSALPLSACPSHRPLAMVTSKIRRKG